MDITERRIEVSLTRAASLFKTLARNPVVRGELLARGLTDAELERGWSLYSALLGFRNGRAAHAVTVTSAEAAQALHAIDAWGATALSAARAVLAHRYPRVERFLFAELSSTKKVPSLVEVERFLERANLLREGSVLGVELEEGRGALELLAARQILNEAKETELRQLIAVAKSGMRGDLRQPEALTAEREQQAIAFLNWLREWREVARVAIKRRDYLASLGLTERRPRALRARRSAPPGPPLRALED